MWVLLTVDPDDLTGVKGSLAGRFADTSALADRSNDVLRSSHSHGCILKFLNKTWVWFPVTDRTFSGS